MTAQLDLFPDQQPAVPPEAEAEPERDVHNGHTLPKRHRLRFLALGDPGSRHKTCALPILMIGFGPVSLPRSDTSGGDVYWSNGPVEG